mmetsp:Transcript_22794/g.31853  ORF Transcript_22794/g.31853 Transcript_22794/m.31853 type:complete len:207 (-) Transcript_22794:267-887(-)
MILLLMIHRHLRRKTLLHCHRHYLLLPPLLHYHCPIDHLPCIPYPQHPLPRLLPRPDLPHIQQFLRLPLLRFRILLPLLLPLLPLVAMPFGMELQESYKYPHMYRELIVPPIPFEYSFQYGRPSKPSFPDVPLVDQSSDEYPPSWPYVHLVLSILFSSYESNIDEFWSDVACFDESKLWESMPSVRQVVAKPCCNFGKVKSFPKDF